MKLILRASIPTVDLKDKNKPSGYLCTQVASIMEPSETERWFSMDIGHDKQKAVSNFTSITDYRGLVLNQKKMPHPMNAWGKSEENKYHRAKRKFFYLIERKSKNRCFGLG